MKWVNHKLIAGATGLVISHNLVFSAAAIIFATAPDAMEMRSYRTGATVLKHRGMSHNPVTWLIIFGSAYAIGYFTGPVIMQHLIPFMKHTIFSSFNALIIQTYLGMIWGVFIHLITDAMTIGGIPIGFGKGFGKWKFKFALKWFYTGSATEYAVSFAIAIASGLIIYVSHQAIVL